MTCLFRRSITSLLLVLCLTLVGLASPVVVSAAGCSPRPPITVNASRSAPGRLAVTVTAQSQVVVDSRASRAGRADVGPRGNAIRQITFGRGANVQPITDLQINGNRATFTLVAAGFGQFFQPFTVIDTLADQCGPWPTFVGDTFAPYVIDRRH